jgi:hypothetical protein
MKNQGVWIKDNSNLQMLKPILHNWTQLIAQYSKFFNGEDACYWYTERANTGILSAAAWKTRNWVALEEYQTTKLDPQGGEKNGRCDLMLASMQDGQQTLFAFEAKQIWYNIAPQKPYAKIQDKMNLAKDDVGKLKKEEGNHRIAASFVIPWLNKKYSESIEDRLAEWLDGLQNNVFQNANTHALAWAFPIETRYLEGKRQHICPGICLLLRERLRSIKMAQ